MCEWCKKNKEPYGTPYTVTEARMAAENNPMDIYHKEIILWLCDKVDELNNTNKIDLIGYLKAKYAKARKSTL